MSLVMDDVKPAVNTLEEVKKLQDLVRKLEIQNQQLRSKHNKISKKGSFSNPKDGVINSSKVLDDSNNEDVRSKTVLNEINREITEENQQLPQRENENADSDSLKYLDELEIIRVSDIDMSDDESWLYVSPKGLTPEQKSESPYQWLRKDVDDPRNKELQLAKKALITKLNALEILSPSSQAKETFNVESACNEPLRKLPVSSKISSPGSNYKGIDTRTFTKSRKKQALEFLESKTVLENCSEIETYKTITEYHRQDSDASLDSSSSIHPLADANDVQEVARMQEESLRMSSPIGTPKRQPGSNVSSRRVSASSKSSVSDMDVSEHATYTIQTVERIEHVIASTPPYSAQCEVYNHSDNSSASESPYGSNVSLNNGGTGKGNGYRRSLPNLNGSNSRLKQNKNQDSRESRQLKPLSTRSGVASPRSDSNLLGRRMRKSETSSPVRQKLRQPVQPANKVPSTNSQTYRTPPNEGTALRIPRSADVSTRLPIKSGLPKPARASSATRSRSGIPMPSTFSKKNEEDSWSEGCF